MEQTIPTTPEAAGSQQESSGTQEAASKVAGQAQEKALQATSQVRDRARDQVSERTSQTGEQVTRAASDIRSVAEELRKQGKDQPAKLADQAADRAERVGDYLKESDADRLLADIERFGRSKPWALALGGVVTGLAASRFLKASSSGRYRASQLRGEAGGSDRARGVRTIGQLPDAGSEATLSRGQ